MGPFDFINAINYTKEDLFEDPQATKDYSAFIVNRGLSYFPDTVMYANEMNRYSFLPAELQFDFLRTAINKKKRFSKWSKKDKETKAISLVKEYYNYSYEKAKEAAKVLTDKQLKIIEEKLEKGGK